MYFFLWKRGWREIVRQLLIRRRTANGQTDESVIYYEPNNLSAHNLGLDTYI